MKSRFSIFLWGILMILMFGYPKLNFLMNTQPNLTRKAIKMEYEINKMASQEIKENFVKTLEVLGQSFDKFCEAWQKPHFNHSDCQTCDLCAVHAPRRIEVRRCAPSPRYALEATALA